MKRIYKAKIVKKNVGSAIEHILPELKGKIITSVYDITTDGDYRLFLVECDDAQNKANLSLEGVSELSEEEAISIAAEYQPERKIKKVDPTTQKEEEITIPKCDLRKYIS